MAASLADLMERAGYGDRDMEEVYRELMQLTPDDLSLGTLYLRGELHSIYGEESSK